MSVQLNLDTITKEIAQEAKSIFGGKLHKVILYGPQARGDYNESSDIDIMVIASIEQNEMYLYKKKLNKLASRLGLTHDVLISITLKEKDMFYKNMNVLPYYKNVINEGIYVYGQ